MAGGQAEAMKLAMRRHEKYFSELAYEEKEVARVH
jgi:hypothetical protein